MAKRDVLFAEDVPKRLLDAGQCTGENGSVAERVLESGRQRDSASQHSLPTGRNCRDRWFANAFQYRADPSTRGVNERSIERTSRSYLSD